MKTTDNSKKHTFSHLGSYPYSFDSYEYKTFQASKDAPVQPGTCCDHCGTGINHVFWFKSADGNRFKVGSSCVEKSDDTGIKNQIKAEVKRIQREQRTASKERKTIARKIARRIKNWGSVRALLRSKPELSRLLRVDNKITADIRTRFLEWGNLSDPQIELLEKLEKQNESYKASKQADEERTWINVPEANGRLTIEGEILSAKYQEQQSYSYGNPTLIPKMLVRVDTLDGSYRVWGTMPAVIEDGSEDFKALRGMRIKFDAKVKRSDNDNGFGFFQRPTKAQLIK